MFSIAKLLPREDKFYRFLQQLTAQASLSAQHLRTFITGHDETARAISGAAIKAPKDEAKRLSAETTRQLCRTFITPFDREDVQDFASGLYKIPKMIDKVREYLELHRVAPVQDLLPQVEVILQEAAAMENLVQALVQGGKSKQIVEQAALLDQLEVQGDAVLGTLLVDLIQNTQDARQLILRKEIYDMLERVIDRYRNVAEVALQIVLKHS